MKVSEGGREDEYGVCGKKSFRKKYIGTFLVVWDSQAAQWQRICLPMQEMWVRSLVQEDPLKEGMAIHSSILALEVPWTEEPGRLQSMGLQRVKHGSVTEHACPWQSNG